VHETAHDPADSPSYRFRNTKPLGIRFYTVLSKYGAQQVTFSRA
jgi:hypothetical protein